MTNTASQPQIGGLVARRINQQGDPLHEFVAHGPTHRIDSVIADRTVTRCGREMRETTAAGFGLVYWPQGVRELPTCRGGCGGFRGVPNDDVNDDPGVPNDEVIP